MKHKVRITFGDYYDDGHGKYETFTMKCTHTSKELLALEPKAETLTGYKFQTNGPRLPSICNDYGDGEISDEVIEDLVKQGFNNDYIVEYDNEENVFQLHTLENGIEDFAEFFMRWLKMVDPKLEWEWMKPDNSDHAIFNCRGYGMFE